MSDPFFIDVSLARHHSLPWDECLVLDLHVDAESHEMNPSILVQYDQEVPTESRVGGWQGMNWRKTVVASSMMRLDSTQQ